MNESHSIDLSELQQLTFRPDWVDKLEHTETASEIVWGYSGGQENRGGRGDQGDRRGQGGGFRGRGDQRGGGERRGGGGFRQDRGPRPAGPPRGDRRDQQQRGPRPGGPPPPGGQGQGQGQGRGERREFRGGERREQRGGQRGPRSRGDFRPDGPGQHREQRPQVPAGWEVRLVPDPRAVEALSKQIKASGRAYAVFDVARLFLSARDRYLLHFFYHAPAAPAKPDKPGEAPAPPTPAAQPELIQCTLDGSLWLTREEAIRHCRETGVLGQLYREEVTEVEAPKGNFTAVAVCGFSGELLGPPNHHAYQTNVARLHRERFANLPLDRYRMRIRVEKDEELLKKWLDQQTKETHYVTSQVAEGEEPVKLKSLTERDAHFLRHHAGEVLRSVTEATVPGNIPGRSLSLGLLSLLKVEVDRQNRFPMHLVQDLCRELESHNLRFFKRDKKTTFVCRSRPHFIGPEVILSDRVRGIIEMVRANPGIQYSKVVSTLAPHTPAPEPVAKETAAEGETPTETSPVLPQLSTEELAIMQDLKWLVQEGYITEFNSGELHILGREHHTREGEKADRPKKAKNEKPATAPAQEPTPPTADDAVEPLPEASSEVTESSASAVEIPAPVETIDDSAPAESSEIRVENLEPVQETQEVAAAADVTGATPSDP